MTSVVAVTRHRGDYTTTSHHPTADTITPTAAPAPHRHRVIVTVDRIASSRRAAQSGAPECRLDVCEPPRGLQRIGSKSRLQLLLLLIPSPARLSTEPAGKSVRPRATRVGPFRAAAATTGRLHQNRQADPLGDLARPAETADAGNAAKAGKATNGTPCGGPEGAGGGAGGRGANTRGRLLAPVDGTQSAPARAGYAPLTPPHRHCRDPLRPPSEPLTPSGARLYGIHEPAPWGSSEAQAPTPGCHPRHRLRIPRAACRLARVRPACATKTGPAANKLLLTASQS